MIKFIICEDNKDHLFNNSNIINSVMMNYNYEYKIFRFEDYNQELRRTYKMSGPKIYLLDIELKTKSGIDIMREIRNHDYNSQIIVVTSHYELSSTVYKSRMLVLDFISKFDNYNTKLKEALQIAVNISSNKEVIKLRSKTSTFFVEKTDIMYVYKENNSKKIIIKTKDNQYEIYKSIIEVEKETKGFLLKASRSMLINTKYVEKIDTKENKIHFKNKEVFDNIISRNYKKVINKDDKYNR